MQLYSSHFLLVLAAASLACSDDDGDAAGESSGGDDSGVTAPSSGPGDSGGADESSTGSAPVDVDMLAACAEDDIAVIPFAGPAFDPNTGELLAPLAVPHVVATTVGWPEPEGWDPLQTYTMTVMADLFQREGLLGASFGISNACGSARTLTLWADEGSMMQFVMGDAHVDAIQNVLSLNKAWETTHWSETTDEAPPTWERARAELDDARVD